MNEVEQIEHLNKIGGNQVYHLVKKLPSDRAFNIFTDNYFSNIKLFKFLHDACGFPSILKIKI